MSNNIKKYVDELGKYREVMGTSAEFTAFLNALATLSDQIDRMSADDHMVNAGEVDGLRNAYNSVFLAQKDYKEHLDHMGGRNAAEQKGILAVVSDTLARDYAGLAGAVVQEGQTYEELMNSGKGLEINVSGQELGRQSGMQSARIPVKFKDKSGKEISGYFTEYTYPNFENERKQLIEKYSAGSPEMASVLRDISKDEKYMYAPISLDMGVIRQQIFNADTFENPDGINSRINAIIKTGRSEKAIAQAREKMGADFNKNVLGFMQEYFQSVGREMMQKNVSAMEKTDKVEDRNAAMSAVADLFGRPDLLARSVKMTVVVDGKPMEGVFMESAPGVDIRTLDLKNETFVKKEFGLNVNMDDELGKDTPFLNNIKGEGALSDPGFLKSMADLQVIDMICGNIDRHNKNKLYQFEEKDGRQVLTGVVGIDNDLSFGTCDMAKKHTSKLPTIEQMKCVSASMAERLMKISPEILTLTLKNYSLTDGEIKAAVKRFEAIKTAITEKKLEIVKDSEWKDIKTYTTSAEKDTGNYFNLSSQIDKTTENEGNAQDEEFKYKLFAEKYKDLPVKTSAVRAEATLIKDVDVKIIKASVEKLILLEHQMDLKDIFYGSPEYDHVHTALQRVINAAKKIGPDSDLYQYKKLQKAYEKLNKDVKTYLDKKDTEERELAKKNKKPSATARERKELISQISDYADKRLSGMKDMFREKYTVEKLTAELKKDSDALFNAHFNAMDFAVWDAKAQAKIALNKNPDLNITVDSIYATAEALAKQPFFKNLAEKYKEKGAVITTDIFRNDLDNAINEYTNEVNRKTRQPENNKKAETDIGRLLPE